MEQGIRTYQIDYFEGSHEKISEVVKQWFSSKKSDSLMHWRKFEVSFSGKFRIRGF